MKVGKTNADGEVAVSVKAAKAGIVIATISGNRKGCNSARVGVIGVFEPPVTG